MLVIVEVICDHWRNFRKCIKEETKEQMSRDTQETAERSVSCFFHYRTSLFGNIILMTYSPLIIFHNLYIIFS